MSIEPMKLYWDSFDEIIALSVIKQTTGIRRINSLQKVEFNENERSSTLYFDDNRDRHITIERMKIIPSGIYYDNDSMYLIIENKLKITDYPAVTTFINKYCPHILSFLTDNQIENMNINLLVGKFNQHSSHSEMTTFMNKFINLNKEENNTLLNSMLLLEIIRRFYCPDEETVDWDINNTDIFKLVRDPIRSYKRIIEADIMTIPRDVIVDRNFINKSGYLYHFNFGAHDILTTSCFHLYNNLAEIKYMDALAHD